MKFYRTCKPILSRFLVIKKFKTKNLYYFLFAVIFFLASCSSSVDSTKKPNPKATITLPKGEERAWIEKFFKKFFLDGEASIYTLFGTKPISAEGISFVTEKEYKDRVLFSLDKTKIKGKEKKGALSWALKSFRRSIFIDDWNKWILFFEQYPNPPFLFAKHPTFSDKFGVGHILNVQETIWTLHKHYEVFKKQLGYDFDPVSVTMDFRNEDSQFWKEVFSNDLLKGIVYGYGYKNSYFFDLMMKFENNTKIEGPRFSSLPMPKVSFPLDKFSLPPFRSFETPFNNDPVLEKYKLEQKKIQSNLNESNFFEMVFLQLIGELPIENKP